MTKDEIRNILHTYDTDSEEFALLEKQTEQNANIKKIVDEVIQEIEAKIPRIPNKERETLQIKEVRTKRIENYWSKQHIFQIAAAILLVTNLSLLGFIYNSKPQNPNVIPLKYTDNDKKAIEDSLDNLRYALEDYANIEELKALINEIDSNKPEKFNQYRVKIESSLENTQDDRLRKIVNDSLILKLLQKE